jgi:AraC-like DNA-binding protein
LLGQTPLEYVTEWRMQKAMQLLEQRDKKLIDVARSVGYESDAAFSKAFKRVVGTNPGEYLKHAFEGHGHAAMAEDPDTGGGAEHPQASRSRTERRGSKATRQTTVCNGKRASRQ